MYETGTPSTWVTVFPSFSAKTFLSAQSPSSLIWKLCLMPVEMWKMLEKRKKHPGFKEVKELPPSFFERVSLDAAWFSFSLTEEPSGHLVGGEGGTTVSTCSRQSPSSS